MPGGTTRYFHPPHRICWPQSPLASRRREWPSRIAHAPGSGAGADEISGGRSDTTNISNPPTNSVDFNAVQAGTPVGQIHGTKWNDLNGDGVRLNEPGLAGVLIYVDLNGNGIHDLGGLYGDYNDDGYVNAADYGVWRKALGTSYQLRNEGPGVTPGMVTQEDFNVWRANFGVIAGEEQAGEPFAITMADDTTTPGIDETGTYWIMDVPTGTYNVREIVPNGFRQTYPNPLTPPGGVSGAHSVTIAAGQVLNNIDFGNQSTTQPGSIHGTKWNDLDHDGVHDIGEPGLAGVTVYADLNGNGAFDIGIDLYTVTAADNPLTPAVDESGTYSMTLPSGSYVIREVVPAGFVESYPTTGATLMDLHSAVMSLL